MESGDKRTQTHPTGEVPMTGKSIGRPQTLKMKKKMDYQKTSSCAAMEEAVLKLNPLGSGDALHLNHIHFH